MCLVNLNGLTAFGATFPCIGSISSEVEVLRAVGVVDSLKCAVDFGRVDANVLSAFRNAPDPCHSAVPLENR